MSKLYGRVNPKSGSTQFYRCAILFTVAWQLLIDLDAATKQRLEEEQMLETSETEPEGYVAPTEEVKQEALGFVDDTLKADDPATDAILTAQTLTHTAHVEAIVSTANALAEVLTNVAPAAEQVDATQTATQTEGATTTTQTEEKPAASAAVQKEPEKPAPAAKPAPAKSTAKAKAAPAKAAPTAKGAK